MFLVALIVLFLACILKIEYTIFLAEFRYFKMYVVTFTLWEFAFTLQIPQADLFYIIRIRQIWIFRLILRSMLDLFTDNVISLIIIILFRLLIFSLLMWVFLVIILVIQIALVTFLFMVNLILLLFFVIVVLWVGTLVLPL